ncbi:SRPBCC family protein [Kitasatospora sp. NPDC057015]|uniref:SRPBCC family protein n=1 Tax=Kitasatospora sp. NPDC057015 TaxID=3346001 RepID=UPI0036454B3A
MADAARLSTAHGVDLLLDANSAFGLLVDLAVWPQLFPAVIHTELLEEVGTRQLGRIWSVADGCPRMWASARTLDWDRRSIGFRRLGSVDPPAFVSGEWRVVDRGNGRCRVMLRQDSTAEVASRAKEAVLREQLGAASVEQLQALGVSVHTGSVHADLQISVASTALLPGGSAGRAIALCEQEALWRRLPLAGARVRAESGPWVADGHRVTCVDLGPAEPEDRRPARRIMQIAPFGAHELVFKELDPPPSVAAHTGRWTADPTGPGSVAVTVRRVVTLDAVGLFAQFGPDVTLPRAREQLRAAILAEDALLLEGLRDAAPGTGGGRS